MSVGSRERRHHAVASLQRTQGSENAIYWCTSARYDPLVHPYSVFVATKYFDGQGLVSWRKKPELTALGTFFLLYTDRNNFTTWRSTDSPILLALRLSIPIASAQPDVDMCHPDPGRHRAPPDETWFLDRLLAVGKDWRGQECYVQEERAWLGSMEQQTGVRRVQTSKQR